VNEIPLDDYLKIVLNPLFDNALPEEVAAAVAIAARGNAWYQVQNPRSDYFTVDANKIGYRGYSVGAKRNGIDTAITDTKNMILTKNNEAFPNNFTGTTPATNPQNSEISLEQAIKLAQKGDHAAEILQKAYPGSKVSLINQ
jgi:stage II sporulation protein D